MHNHSNGNELRILMQIKLISLTIVEHQDSLQNRDKQQLGNDPLVLLVFRPIDWIVIFLVDNSMHPSNNWGLELTLQTTDCSSCSYYSKVF